MWCKGSGPSHSQCSDADLTGHGVITLVIHEESYSEASARHAHFHNVFWWMDCDPCTGFNSQHELFEYTTLNTRYYAFPL